MISDDSGQIFLEHEDLVELKGILKLDSLPSNDTPIVARMCWAISYFHSKLEGIDEQRLKEVAKRFKKLPAHFDFVCETFQLKDKESQSLIAMIVAEAIPEAHFFTGGDSIENKVDFYAYQKHVDEFFSTMYRMQELVKNWSENIGAFTNHARINAHKTFVYLLWHIYREELNETPTVTFNSATQTNSKMVSFAKFAYQMANIEEKNLRKNMLAIK